MRLSLNSKKKKKKRRYKTISRSQILVPHPKYILLVPDIGPRGLSEGTQEGAQVRLHLIKPCAQMFQSAQALCTCVSPAPPGGEVCACAVRPPTPSSGEELCPSRPHPFKCIVGTEKGDLRPGGALVGRFCCSGVLMAFTPRGLEASFFEVLDQHRAFLLAALKRGGEEPAGGGMSLASRYTGSFWGTDWWELGSKKVLPSQA